MSCHSSLVSHCVPQTENNIFYLCLCSAPTMHAWPPWSLSLLCSRGVDKDRISTTIRSLVWTFWNCFKDNAGEAFGRQGRAHNYGLFRAPRYDLELNWCRVTEFPRSTPRQPQMPKGKTTRHQSDASKSRDADIHHHDEHSLNKDYKYIYLNTFITFGLKQAEA